MRQFRDLNDLLCLTDKEIKQYFSNRFYPGDYVFLDDYNLGRIQLRKREGCYLKGPYKKSTLMGYYRYAELIPITKESIRAAYQRVRSSDEFIKKIFVYKLTKLLGIDNVDYIERNSSVTLYFPELTVTNDVGMTHKIRGVYFSFSVIVSIDKKLKLYGFGLDRDTFTYKELFKKYSFSHSNNLFKGSLCLGSTNLGEAFSITETANKLGTIISYLSSENTSGAYMDKQIHKLTNYTLESVNLNFNTEVLENYILSYLIDFEVYNNLIIDDLVFSKPLKEIIAKAYSKGIIDKTQYDKIVVYKLGDASGILTTINKEKLYDEYYGRYIIEFKGVIKKLKIVEELDDDILPEDLEVGVNRQLIGKLKTSVIGEFQNFYNKKIEEHAKQYYSI